MLHLVYFSSVSNNTHRFVQTLDHTQFPAHRIPVRKNETPLEIDTPYVLIVPTYGDRNQSNYVPRQVIKFLSNPNHRHHAKGIIAGGNINFGEDYAKVGDILAQKLHIPYLYRFELAGTSLDTEKVMKGLTQYERQLTNT